MPYLVLLWSSLYCYLLWHFRELLLDKSGKPYKKGTIIKNEKYAITLEKIRDDPYSFYNGSLAEMISEDIRRRISRYQGIKGQVTKQDLRNYTTEIREPLESELAGMKMHLTPPPTSGAVLGLILNILKGRCSVLLPLIIITAFE